MAQKISQGNVFGRIGENFGHTLSEQFPKEVERGRLKSGLQNFTKNMEGKNPIQMASELISIPGITPEHIYTLQPLLKEYQQRNAPGVDNTTAKNTAAVPTIKGEEPLSGQKKPTFKSAEATKAQINPNLKSSPIDIVARSQELSKENPVLYPTPNDALGVAKEEESTRLANIEELKRSGEVADQLAERIRTRLADSWKNTNFAKDIPPQVQQNLLRKIEEDIAQNNLTENEAIDKWKKKGEKIGYNEASLTSLADKWWPEKRTEKIMSEIKNTQKSYADLGEQRVLKDNLISKFGFSEPAASILAYPPKNKEFNNYLKNKVPKNRETVYGAKTKVFDPNLPIKAADEFAKTITPNDSIIAYAKVLENKGINSDPFLKRLKQNQEIGAVKLEPFQEDELARGYPSLPSLRDLWVSSEIGKEIGE